jgi:predicted Fe-Mo cluster-binding NifX family protein
MSYETLQNMSQNASSGAGIRAAQAVADKGARVVLTGSTGPNASQALSAARIKVVTGVSGSVREAIERFKSGQLQTTTTPTTPIGTGTGRGFGMGRGHGGGRGMGRGRRAGMETFTPPAPTSTSTPFTSKTQMSTKQEIQMLEMQMKSTQQQLDQIRKRLTQLKEK